MLVSFTHRLAILAMPKCASTALHAALGPHADIAIDRPPAAKHTTYRRFDRDLRRFLEHHSDGRIETLCLFREPVDWLASWWRYRARADIPDPARSTAGISFDAFVRDYLDRAPKYPVGRPSVFVGARDGSVGVDHLWRYDNLGGCLDWLAARTGWRPALPRLNVSPPPPSPPELEPATRARLHAELARDFEIYATLAR